MSAVLKYLYLVGKIQINCCWLLTYSQRKREKRNEKIEYSYLARLSNTWPACLRCRTLVDTIVLLHVLCWSVQGRLKAVMLCLRYVDTMAFGAWFVLLGVQKKKSRFKNKSFVVFSLEAILLEELIQLL